MSYEDAKNAVNQIRKATSKLNSSYEPLLNNICSTLKEAASYSNIEDAHKPLSKLSVYVEKLGEKLKNEKDPMIKQALIPHYSKLEGMPLTGYETAVNKKKAEHGVKSFKGAAVTAAAEVAGLKKSFEELEHNLSTQISQAESQMKQAESQAKKQQKAAAVDYTKQQKGRESATA